ncbi:hypothetical protein F9U39_21365 [Pectobacterium versatile]|uniref:Uncharacterized protein n=2 Tax=Pectobacterium TaxID=122277 RepID=A0AAW3SVY2_9GAMM|nr:MULTISPECIES: hypothetical protein [Pectobacterium]MBA5204719.1 hypothetical protein [Pectobacterium aroidearum]MBN3176421.1 hypothetical protein [Pectobacterium parmentieri]MBQ4791976.1 hypothetical protein [Pectobacterium versatile]QHQ23390.1 hypothetical protein GMX10_04340 [Pectobacterium parvum]QRN28910.1 hypothetical protein IG623_16465 [Pectobacterium parmentieri]
MSIIKSKMLTDTKPSDETYSQLIKQLNIPEGTLIALMVLEVEYDRKKFYCCLSGGKIINGEPHFTLVGQAAFEALANHQTPNETLTIQEIKVGETPLKNKVKATLKKAPSNSKICFIGDMQGELDGVLSSVFNIEKTIH